MVNTLLASRIKSYIDTAEAPLGTSISHWYVGITHSPKERFASHRLTGTENGQSWGAGTEANARDAETRVLEEGLDGGDGGGKVPVYVYVFRKTNDTEPSLATFRGKPV